MATEPWLPQSLLQRKRNGEALDAPALRRWMRGVAGGQVCDAQLGAFAMAVCLRGMDAQETLALTLAMRDSGESLDWSSADLDGPLLDKHSTGGVGDLTSLVLGPLIAACGGYVPMLSGRGLGHTGGTLDKLESIPGYRCEVDIACLQRVVRKAGLAIVAAGGALAPADQRLYAVRDVTATVDSIPLITASILSKKLAAGSESLVLDIKVGSGATFADRESAAALAHGLVEIAAAAGLPTRALLTAMGEPLAGCVGNALEMRAAIDYLLGISTPPRLHQLVRLLGVEMLQQGGLAADAEDALRRLDAARNSGAAAQCLQQMVAMLGGPADLLDRHHCYLPGAVCRVPVQAMESGVVRAIDARALGMGLVMLGGGRCAPGTAIDPRVGIDGIVAVGTRVEPGMPLAWIHAADAGQAVALRARLRRAFILGQRAEPAPLLLQRIVACSDAEVTV